MQKILYTIIGFISTVAISAQNLVVNPKAENLPKGTGWTIVSAGAQACLVAPTTTYNNWTMVPDGSAFYPFDRSSGAAGGTVFFSGCSNANLGPFELKQDINVSSSAINIDLGKIQYTFSGFIQTPVNDVPGGQQDQGRFIIDYLDASNVVLGASFTSPWQSFALGSGDAWIKHSDIRKAPVGTRKLTVRLQTQIFGEAPEINVYFDDISVVKVATLPVTLLSFTGSAVEADINIKWKTEEEINLLQYQLERSTNGTNFTTIAAVAAGKNNYAYTDKSAGGFDKYFYRLKMLDKDGKYSYSDILTIKTKLQQTLKIAPNPAKNSITVNGLTKPGVITILNAGGKLVLSAQTRTNTTTLNIAALSSGLYFIRFNDGEKLSYQKLVVE